MATQPIHKFFGTSLDDWIRGIPNELDVDAVGLWQIIPVGRDDFGLTGEELKKFVENSIQILLESGAVPVKPSSREGKFWEPDMAFQGKDFAQIAQKVIQDWEMSGKEPNQDDIWFARL